MGNTRNSKWVYMETQPHKPGLQLGTFSCCLSSSLSPAGGIGRDAGEGEVKGFKQDSMPAMAEKKGWSYFGSLLVQSGERPE